MDDKPANEGTTVLDSTLAASGQQASSLKTKTGFFRRYRLPLSLAVIAICLYAGSILYILFGRGQVI
ncbi:hypothetical protein OAM69_06505 [bacterium]|nr:hypothetical protein [bacterium]